MQRVIGISVSALMYVACLLLCCQVSAHRTDKDKRLVRTKYSNPPSDVEIVHGFKSEADVAANAHTKQLKRVRFADNVALCEGNRHGGGEDSNSASRETDAEPKTRRDGRDGRNDDSEMSPAGFTKSDAQIVPISALCWSLTIAACAISCLG